MFHFTWRRGVRDDGRKGDTQQETLSQAQTMGLYRVSTFYQVSYWDARVRDIIFRTESSSLNDFMDSNTLNKHTHHCQKSMKFRDHSSLCLCSIHICKLLMTYTLASVAWSCILWTITENPSRVLHKEIWQSSYEGWMVYTLIENSKMRDIYFYYGNCNSSITYECIFEIQCKIRNWILISVDISTGMSFYFSAPQFSSFPLS